MSASELLRRKYSALKHEFPAAIIWYAVKQLSDHLSKAWDSGSDNRQVSEAVARARAGRLALRRMDTDQLTIVTGASSNHFSCLKNLLSSIRHFEPSTRVIVYDLGLLDDESAQLINDGSEFRIFDFSQCPPHVNIEHERGHYAWKPIIIADTLREVGGALLWLDSGCLIHAPLRRVRKVLRDTGVYSPRSLDTVKRWTHPATLTYLEAQTDLLEKPNRSGGVAGFNAAIGGVTELVERWRECALDERCIAPKGSDRSNHRQDQAVLTILLYQYQKRYGYVLEDEKLDISTHNDSLASGQEWEPSNRRREMESHSRSRQPLREDSMARIVQITCLGGKGRFGNQLFQYAFARAYAERNNAVLETPHWIGQELFGLSDPPPSRKLPRTPLDKPPSDGRVNIDLYGYFCWSGNLARQPWTVDDVRHWFTFTDSALAKHPTPHAPYIAAHLRRGDFRRNLYRTCIVCRKSYERALRWNGLDSDTVVWVSEESGNPMLQDFLTLMHSDVLFLSNSSFSFWAGLLGGQKCFAPLCEDLTGWVNCRFVPGHRYVRKWARNRQSMQRARSKAKLRSRKDMVTSRPVVPSLAGIPIGIVTRNRAVYLDVTLRSLSATDLPDASEVTVYDDASDEPDAHRFLYTSSEIQTIHSWPTCPKWTAQNLHVLSNDPVLHGIADKVRVVKLGQQPLGVANASCAALCHMFVRFPDAPAVILLQDDVLFNRDWYYRMLREAENLEAFDCRCGILSGMHISEHRIRARTKAGSLMVNLSTAQCYYVSRSFFEKNHEWFHGTEHGKRGFDRSICELSYRSGFDVRVMLPFVCVHIGFASTVRPSWTFFNQARPDGRFGLNSQPPYAMAGRVRPFKSSPVSEMCQGTS